MHSPAPSGSLPPTLPLHPSKQQALTPAFLSRCRQECWERMHVRRQVAPPFHASALPTTALFPPSHPCWALCATARLRGLRLTGRAWGKGRRHSTVMRFLQRSFGSTGGAEQRRCLPWHSCHSRCQGVCSCCEPPLTAIGHDAVSAASTVQDTCTCVYVCVCEREPAAAFILKHAVTAVRSQPRSWLQGCPGMGGKLVAKASTVVDQLLVASASRSMRRNAGPQE
eukprot:1160336-Pelagomonas_calceolata.AAC.2